MNKDYLKGKKIDLTKLYPVFFTLIFVAILFQYSFSSLESILYDARIKYDWGISHRDNIVLITMDEESDMFLGETYPYTYASHDKLIKRLLKDQPAVINYFINQNSPSSQRETDALIKFKATVSTFVKGGGEFRYGTDVDFWGEKVPPEELKELGYSPALLNIDNSVFAKDDVSRRAIINISGEDTLHLWTANKYRQKSGDSILDASSILGSYYLRESDATFSLFRYYASPLESKGRIKRIPFHRVLVGNFPKGFFSNKIILLGPSYISNASDYVLTPFNQDEYTTSKLTIHAQIIQSLIQNKTIYQIPRYVSYIIAAFIAVFLSFIISRLKPSAGLMITIYVLLGIVLIGYLLFVIFGLWLYLTHLVLTVFSVYYIWVPFRAIGEYQRRFAIQEETKLLKKVENLKQNFISLMSHDLKTPVAKIAGLADILIHKYRSDTDLSKNLTSIVDATIELNKFITSILDLTKIESSNLELNTESKDINGIIDGVVDNLNYEASLKEVSLIKELAPLYPIEFDIILIRRVISNLVENSIKYSGNNTVVSVKSWDDNDWVYIEISDNGVGIPEKDIEFIFEKFYRVKNDASHSIKGTGLGLYLVKYFVELHGGQISVTSNINEGTTFLIKLKNE